MLYEKRGGVGTNPIKLCNLSRIRCNFVPKQEKECHKEERRKDVEDYLKALEREAENRRKSMRFTSKTREIRVRADPREMVRFVSEAVVHL